MKWIKRLFCYHDFGQTCSDYINMQHVKMCKKCGYTLTKPMVMDSSYFYMGTWHLDYNGTSKNAEEKK